MIIKLSKESEIGKNSLSASKKHIKGDTSTHWHEFYEIEYILDGNGICNINSQEFSMQAGKIFFMTPVDFHTVKAADADVINLMFSAEMATPGVLVPFTSLKAPKAITIPPENRQFIETVLEEIVNNKNKTQLCAALIDVLLLKLCEYFDALQKNAKYSLSQKMTFYIINHFREKIGLNDAADAVGITPTYASAVFKQEIGISFKAYLNNLRFDYAKKLLLYSDMTVQQVCSESGFEDYPNFIRRFKQRVGMSPTQFRKGADIYQQRK